MEKQEPWIAVDLRKENGLWIHDFKDLVESFKSDEETNLPCVHVFYDGAIVAPVYKKVFREILSQISLPENHYAFFNFYVDDKIDSLAAKHPRNNGHSNGSMESNFKFDQGGARKIAILMGSQYESAYECVSWTQDDYEYCRRKEFKPRGVDYTQHVDPGKMKIQFPTLTINGKTIEGRVGMDATWGTANESVDLTLCSLAGLPAINESIGEHKKMAIVHDQNRGTPKVYNGEITSNWFSFRNRPRQVSKHNGVLLKY